MRLQNAAAQGKMPKEEPQPFAYRPREEDIERLASEVQQRYEQQKGGGLEEREAVREAVKNLGSEQEPQLEEAPSPSAAGEEHPAPHGNVIPEYAKEEPPEIQAQIEELVTLALNKGIEVANRKARAYPPYIVDAFHDALTGVVYQELKQRGLL